MHVWSFGVVVWNPGGPTRPGRRGFTRQPENSKRAHLSVPALQTPPKFHEKTPEREEQMYISCGREKKKREILGPPPFRPPTLRAPTLRAPTLRARTLRAPTPPGPNPSRPPPKTKLAKCGLANFGQQKLAKFGQMRMAKCGQLTLAKCGHGPIISVDGFGRIRSRLSQGHVAGSDGSGRWTTVAPFRPNFL